MISVIVLIVISVILGILIYKTEGDLAFAVITFAISYAVLGGIFFLISETWIPSNVTETKDYTVHEAPNKEAYYINDNNEIVKVGNLSYYNVSYGNVLKPTIRKKEYDNTYVVKFPTFEFIMPNRDIVED